MTYQDLSDAVSVLNTGSTTPDKLALLTKLVVGKMTKKRLPSLQKLATISTSGSNTINLRTLLPDFFDFKIDQNNHDKIIYSLDADGNTTFYKLVSPVEFAGFSGGYYAKKEGSVITLSQPSGESVPSTIYFPYFSFYAWADGSTDTPKEYPVSNDDYTLIPQVFDDVLVDGLLLMISRREKEDKEYTKNSLEWERRLNEIIFYS